MQTIPQSEIEAAESVLYSWACGHLPTAAAKAKCLDLGFRIDFRQSDYCPYVEAFHWPTGRDVALEL